MAPSSSSSFRRLVLLLMISSTLAAKMAAEIGADGNIINYGRQENSPSSAVKLLSGIFKDKRGKDKVSAGEKDEKEAKKDPFAQQREAAMGFWRVDEFQRRLKTDPLLRLSAIFLLCYPLLYVLRELRKRWSEQATERKLKAVREERNLPADGLSPADVYHAWERREEARAEQRAKKRALARDVCLVVLKPEANSARAQQVVREAMEASGDLELLRDLEK